MNDTAKRSELIARLKASRQRKRDHLVKLEQSMRRDYRKKMGIDAKSFNVL